VITWLTNGSKNPINLIKFASKKHVKSPRKSLEKVDPPYFDFHITSAQELETPLLLLIIQ
jgi:hypothetical protein